MAVIQSPPATLGLNASGCEKLMIVTERPSPVLTGLPQAKLASETGFVNHRWRGFLGAPPEI